MGLADVALLDYRDVGVLGGNDAADRPTRAVQQPRQLLLGDHEVVEPPRRVVAVADPDADLTRQPAAIAVSLLITDAGWIGRPVDVTALGDDSPAVAGQPVPQQPPGLRGAREQA